MPGTMQAGDTIIAVPDSKGGVAAGGNTQTQVFVQIFEKGGEIVALDLIGMQVSHFLLPDLRGPEATARRSSGFVGVCAAVPAHPVEEEVHQLAGRPASFVAVLRPVR